jgi:co-chaperonin GroES (HSP10)
MDQQYIYSGKFDGTAIKYNDEECQIIRDDNVLLMYEGVTLRLDNAIPVRDYVLVELPESGSSSQSSSLTTESGIMLAGQAIRDQLPCEGIVRRSNECQGRVDQVPGQSGRPYQV